ncbi:trehalose-phosphatase [Bartonella sp. DGB2]|uniref:trehalose-phosphatase n=1 Tax=Bartonella sp. DGB2 TaxID=3388426 RepID=UPI00398FDF8C
MINFIQNSGFSALEQACARLTMDKIAFFFDIDGTLLDIADHPAGVSSPAGLVDSLKKLSLKLGGALALVTGRSVASADQIFGYPFTIAGLYGAEIRSSDGFVQRYEIPASFKRAKTFLQKVIKPFPALFLEDKGHGVAVHFRCLPSLAPRVMEIMVEAADIAGPFYTIQKGKMLLELKLAALDKGRAVDHFMNGPRFAERVPICFGDDVGDEAMFARIQQLGGLAFHIGRLPTCSAALYCLDTPAALRKWLMDGLI